jgi:hypothetical protein
MAFRQKDAFGASVSTNAANFLSMGRAPPRGISARKQIARTRGLLNKSRDPNSIYFAGLIRPLPRHCLQAGGKIFRLGLSGCGTVGKPVPLHAGQLTSVDTVIDFIMAIIAQK